MSVDAETPIEEWKTSKKGRDYVVLGGPGGGTVFRKGDETIDEARARKAVQDEIRRRRKAEQPAGAGETAKPRPRGKGRKADPRPGPTAAKDPGKPKATPEMLAGAAEVPLRVFAAFAGHQLLACDFCANAMQANAGAAARDLANTSNPYLLSLLTWWHSLIAGFAGADGLVQFIAPPIVHHALPAPMAAFVSPIMGVPQRPAPTPGHDHAHAQPPPSNGQPPAGQAAADELAARLQHERDELLARQRASSVRVPNVPPYSARANAPGTPTAPLTDPAASAGNPLPPEA